MAAEKGDDINGDNMKLVYEDDYGAYSGVRAEFLEKFVLKESNPNFDVYDSRDNNNRFIAVKSSRLPDDQDLAAGRYGIDFNRAKPGLQEALQYSTELPDALENMKWLANMSFAANTRDEYDRKSSVWDNFYSCIWGSEPKTIWVTPHSGSVARVPDDILPYPKLVIDAFTAGVAASCAFNIRNKALKRLMISIHSSSFLGTIFELGGFGIIDEEKLFAVAAKIEMKYHERVQSLADEHKQYFCLIATRWLEHIKNKQGTLDPAALNHTSTTDKRRVDLIAKELKLYGQEIKGFTLEEFEEVIRSVSEIEVPVISSNYIFPASHVGKILKISEKIGRGLLHSALNIECSKPYLAKEPELMTNIILDIKNEFFN
jgi:hypothetical protein